VSKAKSGVEEFKWYLENFVLPFFSPGHAKYVMVAWMIQESVVCLCLGSLIRSFTGAGCVTKRTAELELLREENVSADRTNILLTRCC